MNRYEGVKCPVCGEAFGADDNIVVCPDCGTPHHRFCVQNHGGCAFADKHESGYRFELPESKKEQKNLVPCPACRCENDPDNLYCDKCGLPLKKADGQNFAPGEQPKGGFVNAPFIRVAVMQETPVKPDDEIDGVSVKELSAYVGESPHYYIPRFKDMKSGGRRYGVINFSAFLFQFWYFVYRKMWGAAAMSFGGSIIAAIPNVIMYFASQSAITVNLSRETMALCGALSFIALMIRFALAMASNRMYMNKVFKKVKRIKAVAPTDEYEHILSRTGGVSKTSVLICGAVYFSFVFAVSALLTAGMI